MSERYKQLIKNPSRVCPKTILPRAYLDLWRTRLHPCFTILFVPLILRITDAI